MRRSINIDRSLKQIPVLLLFAALLIYAEDEDTAMRRIKENRSFLSAASKIFDVDVNLLAAVIFTERTMNYDWRDEALDNIIAEAGMNSSIGFCQIKIKTAYWIEVQLNDERSRFYPGYKYRGILEVSESGGELLSKLNNDSLNILYAAAYIKIIERRWESSEFPLEGRPEITATLYSTGLFYKNGEERVPRKDAEANNFGRTAAERLKRRNFEGRGMVGLRVYGIPNLLPM